MLKFKSINLLIIRRSLIAAGSFMVMCAISGCRSTSTQTVHRPALSQSISYATPSDPEPAQNELVTDQTSTLTEAVDSVPAVALTEDEVISLFRQSGGTLRPNDTGEIVEIDLAFTEISDAQLAGIVMFPELAELDLTGTGLHDACLSSLLEMKNLRAVKLKGTKVTNDGFRLLSQIPALVLLDASNTAVTDDGLVDAGQWTNLRYLSMNNTAVSDTGLKHLESLRDLKGLSVINTAVTEAGVLNLKKALPDCLIVAQTERKQSRAETLDAIPRLPALDPSNSTIVGIASHQQLAQVIQLAGQQPHLAVHLSRIYSSCELWPETVLVLATASAADPNDSGIHAALGEALARSGHPEEALRHFEQSFDESRARYIVGMIMYENNLRTSERYFDDVLQADPTFSAAHLRRDRIQQELASLRLRPRTPVSNGIPASVPEILPAPLIRTASQSRQLSHR